MDQFYVGQISSFLIAFWVAWYTANNSWKKEKYFKLQQVTEEIILYLWRREDLHMKYGDKKEQLLFEGELVKTEKDLEKHLEKSDKLNQLGDQKQDYHQMIFSKIQVYFSEPGLSEVREKSEKLSKVMNGWFSAMTDEEKDNLKEELRKQIVNFRSVIIAKTNLYGENWIYRIWRY